MIKKFVLALILMTNLLLTHHCLAAGEFDGYIVTLKECETVSLFSDGDLTDSMEPLVPDRNIYKVDSSEELQDMIDAGMVEYAEPDYTVTLFDNLFVPEDPYYSRLNDNISYQYGIDMTKINSCWDMGLFGDGVRIGVIDSGIYPHNELLDNVIPGYNYTVATSVCKKGTACTNTDCSHYDYFDTYNHGTFVSGIIGSKANDNLIIGAVPEAEVVPLRSFVSKTASISNIFPAIYDAVDKFDCDVINMSFGLYSTSSNLKNAIEYAKSKNVIIVAAAGNDNVSTKIYPGSYDGVICVGSVDAAGAKSDFSNHGSHVDIAAPGTSIYSCLNTGANSFGKSSGTSFSTPYVTSVAAMCKMIKPDMTSAEFESLLTSNATPFAEGFSHSLGSGIMNAENMLLSLIEGKDIYYSPINRFYGKTFRMISNFSDTEFGFADIWKGNDTVSYNSISLPSYSTYMAEFEEESSAINYIWDSITTLKPIKKDEFILE